MPMAVESAGSAMAAQAKANVEARFLVAMNNRRNWDDVRVELLKECKRPDFANNLSAYYKKPIGKGVEGLGIRFVEVAFRCMRNIMPEITMIWEDEHKEICRVSVTDLESNVTYSMDIKISKTIERRQAPAEIIISSRINSYGKTVHTIPATDDELLNKREALISKAVRTLGIRLVPGDLQDEATRIIKEVRLNKAAADPGAERKAIVDAFAALNVKPSDLAKYIGHDIGQCSPAELVDLRALHGAIKDGEATWAEVMDNKELNEGPTNPEEKLKEEAKENGDIIDIEEEPAGTTCPGCGEANGHAEGCVAPDAELPGKPIKEEPQQDPSKGETNTSTEEPDTETENPAEGMPKRLF
jgi:hypothetical protein